MIYIKDTSGTNINVQVIDTKKVGENKSQFKKENIKGEPPVIIVMDYAFGEQAYENYGRIIKAL